MQFQDRTLRCADCGSDFVWTAGEQAFFADKRFTNEPKRCKICRDKRKNSGMGDGGSRRLYSVTCDACGKATQVPFNPTNGKPVYCRDCYRDRRAGMGR